MRRALFLLLVCSVWVCGAEVYFSPDGGIQNQIIRRIDHTRSSIDIAMYSFSDDRIARALAQARRRGVAIRVIRDASQSKNKKDENVFLRANGIKVKVMRGKGRGVFHHKFALFDNETVQTGSFNWTVNGEKHNHENALFFNDRETVLAFRKEFEKLWQKPLPQSSKRGRRPS